MLIHPTQERRSPWAPDIARISQKQRSTPDLDRVGIMADQMADQEATERETKRLTARLYFASLWQDASVKGIDLSTPRGPDGGLMARLVAKDSIDYHHTVMIIGSSDIGSNRV